MRKMLSFMMTSADGYHADPGEALDWHNVDHEFSQFALAQLREAWGCSCFGRVTYEGMAAFLLCARSASSPARRSRRR